MGRKSGEALGLSYCHGLGGNQVFAYTKRQQVMSDDICLDAASASGPVKLVRCHGMGGNQAWNYNEVVSQSVNVKSKLNFKRVAKLHHQLDKEVLNILPSFLSHRTRVFGT